jgi:hypothetical protein
VALPGDTNENFGAQAGECQSLRHWQINKRDPFFHSPWKFHENTEII